MALRISAFSSVVNLIFKAARFSSRAEVLVVPLKKGVCVNKQSFESGHDTLFLLGRDKKKEESIGKGNYSRDGNNVVALRQQPRQRQLTRRDVLLFRQLRNRVHQL